MNELMSVDDASQTPPDVHRPAWEVVSASVRGSSHEQNGLPCQDANAGRLIGEGWVAVAVADGAGSALFADVGAQAAVNCAVDVMTRHVSAHLANERTVSGEPEWKKVMEDVLQLSRRAVEKEAESRRVRVRELASTLLVVLLGPELTVAAQVGDGGTVVRFEDGSIDALTRPPAGEFVNETTFLTDLNENPFEGDPDAASAQFTFRPGPVRAAASTTDGLQMLAFEYPAWTPFVPFFQPLFDFFEDQEDPEAARSGLERILISPNVRNRTGDDITLVVTTRKPRALRQSAEASL
jgi:hypothetical protein